MSGKQKQRALVIGDAMLDAWCFGTVERFSREAPVPIFLENREKHFSPGGAANTAAHLAAMGVDTSLFAVLGDDAEGIRLLSLLSEAGVHTDDVEIWPERATLLKQRYYNDNCRQMLRVDREDHAEDLPAREQELLLKLQQLVGSFDMILLSEYRRSFITERFIRELITLARRRGIPVLVDPVGSDPGKYRGATLIKPNRSELGQLTGRPVLTEETAAEAAAELCRRAECDYVLATLDKDGILLADRDGLMQRVNNSMIRTEGNNNALTCRTVGAGDEVLARFAAAVLDGRDVREAAVFANSIKGVTVCGKRDCTGHRLQGNDPPAHSVKILDNEDISFLDPQGRSGKHLVFTNGCFDLVHAGHVMCLQEARRMGDILVVGVNSDASVSRLKGADRPVWPLADRMAVLAALECVDYIIPFEEDTPLHLIERIRPDVLVKGGDYQLPGIIGADVVLSYGGLVQTVPFLKGRSSTAAISRICSLIDKDIE